MTETTVNMKIEYLARVRQASIRCNVPLYRIVEKILQKMVAAVRYSRRIGTPALYQERCRETDWGCFHLYIPEALFEQCLDLRKLCKRSLSRLFAEGIDAYLDDVIADLTDCERKSCDNNRYFYHIRFAMRSDGYGFSAFAAQREEKRRKQRRRENI